VKNEAIFDKKQLFLKFDKNGYFEFDITHYLIDFNAHCISYKNTIK